MLKIALGMLLSGKVRLWFSLLGIGTLFFLSASQVGLLVGWCNTISAIICHTEGDLWIIASQTPTFDYGSPIPQHRVYQTRNVPGVSWAEAIHVGWSVWQRPDGRRMSVALIGLDKESVGGPWVMVQGKVEEVHLPDSVIIDELFMGQLGVAHVGDEVELHGRRAVVRGISRGVRTFTAMPFVFTSLHSAFLYDRRYDPGDITYVIARAGPDINPEDVAAAIQKQVPSVEVLTSAQFARRSTEYWMLETGIGITVSLTALLGVVVCTVVTSQTLFSITHDHIGNYSTLLAIGFTRLQLLRVVLYQGLILGGGGIGVGSGIFFLAASGSQRTPVPLETTPAVFAMLVGVSLGSCVLGAVLSVRAVWSIDPLSVFRG